MTEIIFSNLDELVEQPDRIDKVAGKTRWQTMAYEAGNVKGTLLFAGELANPQNITLKLGLKGWHKIFLCIDKLIGGKQYMCVKLSGDVGYTGVQLPKYENRHLWQEKEYAKEFYWKSADLTDQDVILSKTETIGENTCCLLWIRCVPMDKDDVEEYLSYKQTKSTKCIHGYIDPTQYIIDDISTESENIITKLVPLIDTDFKEISLDISFSFDKTENFLSGANDLLPASKMLYMWDKANRDFYRENEKVQKERVSFLHDRDLMVYAANRMCVTSFNNVCETYKQAFAEKHPEFYTVMRDRSVVKVCSYAFPEVQEYVIQNLLDFIKYGFDGLTLIYNRGLHIAFEKPVIDRLVSRYPGINPFELPTTDQRLHETWCEIMTEFMRKLRMELNRISKEHLRINVIVDVTAESCKNFGLDIETWAREKLVDSVMQGNILGTREDIDDCMKAEGIIDLDLYKEKAKKEYVIKRDISSDTERILKNAPDFISMCQEHRVDFYGAMPWQHSLETQKYPEFIRQMKSLGIKKFFCWDICEIVKDLPEFHALSMAGHDEISEETYRIWCHKLCSLNESNMSIFQQDFKG